jgi:hypothetical protein
MAAKARAQVTRAERRRAAADARTRSNLRSVAIARSVVQAMGEAQRAQAMENFRAFMALTDRPATAGEIERASEALATPVAARQATLFRGNA